MITMDSKEIVVAIKCWAYNHEPYIRDCLDGFVMQETDFKFVAIVHDDASTDKTAEIIREYEAKYPDIIKPIYETENQYSKNDGSLARIMDEAIDATGAKYIAMCEGDDYWTDPLKLQKQVEFLEQNSNISMCYTDFSLRDEIDNIVVQDVFESGYWLRPKNFIQHLLRGGYIAPPTWIMKVDSVPDNPNNHIDASFCIALEYFAMGEIGYIPNATSVYCLHEGSASHELTIEKKARYSRDICQIQYEYAEKYNLLDAQIPIIDYDHAVRCGGCCALLAKQHNNIMQSVLYLLFALRHVRNLHILKVFIKYVAIYFHLKSHEYYY